jgi:hypothetical protein
MIDIARAAAKPWSTSATIARTITIPAAAASAWMKRAAISSSTVGASGQHAGRRGHDRPDQQRPSPSEAVGDRPPGDLSEREPDQEGGEGQLHVARRRAEVGADLREGGQVEVDRKRRGRREQGEREQEPRRD